jgi:hypothetical protein
MKDEQQQTDAEEEQRDGNGDEDGADHRPAALERAAAGEQTLARS